MPPAGESLKSPSTLRAAELWWGEEQGDKAAGDAVVLQLSKAGDAGKLRGGDFMSPSTEI